MSDTPRTDAAIIERRHIHKICGCLELLELVDADVARKLERECNQLREALQSVMDWNPKPEYWERPEGVARFEVDMARAREVLELEEAQETKPHHWEDRALTAERERDEALNVLREINDWINVAVMRPPTPNEAADAINTWGDKIRPILETTE